MSDKQFIPEKGDRIRRNWWVDRRESGWKEGLVISNPFSIHGAICVKVDWGDYISETSVSFIEPAIT